MSYFQSKFHKPFYNHQKKILVDTILIKGKRKNMKKPTLAKLAQRIKDLVQELQENHNVKE